MAGYTFTLLETSMTFQKHNPLVNSAYYVTRVHHLQSCVCASLSSQVTFSNNTTNLVHVGSALCLLFAFSLPNINTIKVMSILNTIIKKPLI
jgi:hypothetical protein